MSACTITLSAMGPLGVLLQPPFVKSSRPPATKVARAMSQRCDDVEVRMSYEMVDTPKRPNERGTLGVSECRAHPLLLHQHRRRLLLCSVIYVGFGPERTRYYLYLTKEL